jgi:hypothetical protein
VDTFSNVFILESDFTQQAIRLVAHFAAQFVRSAHLEYLPYSWAISSASSAMFAAASLPAATLAESDDPPHIGGEHRPRLKYLPGQEQTIGLMPNPFVNAAQVGAYDWRACRE